EETLEIPIRDDYTSKALLTRPTFTTNPGPLIVLLHPGGFFLGSPAKLTMYARPLAQLFNASVLCPSYRFAPEHPFPIGVEDAWSAVKWAARHAPELGADPSKGFLIGSMSSGANFAVALTRRSVETGLQPPVTGTWAPNLIAFNGEACIPDEYKELWKSHEQHSDALVIDSRKAATIWKYYKPLAASPMFNPLAQPLEQFISMPKVFLQVSGHDLFRDDGLIVSYALQDNGVPARLRVYPGVCHSFWGFAPKLAISKRFLADIVEGFAWLLELDTRSLDRNWETMISVPSVKL
ncbi:alpha/beta-hydrolase, partial [Aaosphaeria arxii CBS 175.79]